MAEGEVTACLTEVFDVGVECANVDQRFFE